jgi:hypothetical protein
MLKAKRQEESTSHPGPDEAPLSGLSLANRSVSQTDAGQLRITEHIKEPN